MSRATLAEFLADVKERCEKATKGPWEWRGTVHDYYLSRADDAETYGIEDAIIRAVDDHLVVARRDKPIIAHARTDTEALVKMLECLVDHQNAMLKAAHSRQGACEWVVRGLNKLEALVPEERS